MSDGTRHDELEASVAAWVLGALEPAEAQTIAAHAEGCATCREVAVRLRRVVGALPVAVDEVTPPARLRGRLLAAAAASRGRTERPIAMRRPPRPVPVPRSTAQRMPLYAMAAVAVVALLIGVLVGQIAAQRSQGTAQEQVARFTLTGHEDMAGAKATVVDLKADGVALLDFRGLPPPGANRVYEVWLVPAQGSPVPAAVFVPDAGGGKVVLVNRALAGYAVMAVTNEPAPDGSSQPSQQPRLYGNVA